MERLGIADLGWLWGAARQTTAWRALALLVALAALPSLALRATTAAELRDTIDAEVSAAWEKQQITPAAASSDPEFLRRVYLDLVGVIPTYDETVAFGFEPYYVCDEEERFRATFYHRHGQALKLGELPPGRWNATCSQTETCKWPISIRTSSSTAPVPQRCVSMRTRSAARSKG